jgi:hypothetical protein
VGLTGVPCSGESLVIVSTQYVSFLSGVSLLKSTTCIVFNSKLSPGGTTHLSAHSSALR